jgi:tryptophan-rich sensory protein
MKSLFGFAYVVLFIACGVVAVCMWVEVDKHTSMEIAGWTIAFLALADALLIRMKYED